MQLLSIEIISWAENQWTFCSKHGHLEEATRIFHEMVSKGLKPDVFTYNTFVACYTNRGMLTEALNVVKHMKKSGCKPGEVTYRTLVDAYCKLGRYEDVERILKFIKQTDPNFDKAAFRRIAARVSEYDRQP